MNFCLEVSNETYKMNKLLKRLSFNVSGFYFVLIETVTICPTAWSRSIKLVNASMTYYVIYIDTLQASIFKLVARLLPSPRFATLHCINPTPFWHLELQQSRHAKTVTSGLIVRYLERDMLVQQVHS